MNISKNNPHRELLLPDDIRVINFLGEGGRTYVYQAQMDSQDVIVKVYKEEVAKKYFDKYNVDIALFEYERNQALYNLPKIREYIAKPFRLYSFTSGQTHSIIQERVTGTVLEDLIKKLGYLPKEILEAGYTIVKQAELNDIHDLDISVGNLVVNNIDGKWKPKLYDFNLMPQYLFPPNPIISLAIKTGIRKKSYRDYRSLRNWKRRGEKRIWIGRN